MTGAAPRVAVVGAGAWGTTLAALIARAEPVTLLCHSPEVAAEIVATRRNERRLPGVTLSERVVATASADALRDAIDLVVFAVPSPHLRSTVESVAPVPGARCGRPVRGQGPGGRIARSDERGHRRGRAASRWRGSRRCPARTWRPRSPATCRRPLSSPRPTSLLAERVVARLARRRFRLYVNEDILGVELCGALKNVVAIAAGAADALGFGDNGKAGLLTRGLAEMTRLGIAAGANPLTFAGLAGMGDLIATCGSHLSRNHRLGEELAAGRSWAEIEALLPGRRRGRLHGRRGLGAGRTARCRDAHRAAGPSRAVRGQERPALPGRPAGSRVEGRARRLRSLDGPARGAAGRGRGDLGRLRRPRIRLPVGPFDGGAVLDSRFVGAWRSLVAHQSGGLVVVGSNPAAPTNIRA